MLSNRNSHSLLVGMQNGIDTLQDSLAVLTKLHILLPYDPGITLLDIYPNELKTYVHTKTCLRMYTITLFIITKTWKQPRMSFRRWLDKYTVVHPHNGRDSVLKVNELSSHEKIWRELKCVLVSERSQSEKATYYMIPMIWHSGKGKTMETVKISVVSRGLGWRKGWPGGAQRIFSRVKSLCIILSWWINVIICLSKPIDLQHQRMDPNVNYGLWVIMCQCRFVDCNKCTLWWRMLRMGKAMHVLGQGVYGKFLYFLLNFAVNLKLL